jgi:tRNA pseudouridine38-40 synthase
MRIALGIEYDGRGFLGWQSQPGGNTLQDVVEKAISSIAGETVRVFCAGRTDTGVHALAQVVHFDTSSERPQSAWVRGVNAFLPPSVAIRWAKPVGEEFHARYAARSRSYRYLLLNRLERPGLWTGKVGWYHRPLDIATVRQAAASLLGEHDFSSFRSSECQAKSPVKTLQSCTVINSGDLLVFEFQANAFLHHMVRNLVGALVYVGSGRLSPEAFVRILAARDRSQAPPTFAPDGLYFAGVEYDAVWGLPLVQGMILPTALKTS